MSNEKSNSLNFDTIALHEGQTIDPITRSRAVPILSNDFLYVR